MKPLKSKVIIPLIVFLSGLFFTFNASAESAPSETPLYIGVIKTVFGLRKGNLTYDLNLDESIDIMDACLAKKRHIDANMPEYYQVYGIDVSTHQKEIDWKKVKADGIQFAMIRAGYGREVSQKDAYFDINMKNAKSAGIQCGAYWYSYAKTPEEALLEAKACLEVIKGYKFEYPIIFDIEDPSQRDLGKGVISSIIEVFCSTLEANGYYVGIYSYKYFLNTYINTELLYRYDVWLAHWTDKTDYDKPYSIWQYTSSGQVDGISGRVDMNISYRDYLPIFRKYSLNGY